MANFEGGPSTEQLMAAVAADPEALAALRGVEASVRDLKI